jgi:hypothetical protein
VGKKTCASRKLIDERSDFLIIYSCIHIDQHNRDVLPINDGSDIPAMMLASPSR